MSGCVIATAGHVDHGKSTLVRALTGIEPDRWAAERERGLTIDLGFAWTTLPSGRQLAFVDVPGHERFVANMLAGLGPVPIVCFVIAADAGWQAQSSEHRDAIAALGIPHGLVIITKADLAAGAVPEVRARVRAELRGTALAAAPVVACSARTGEGLDEVRAALDAVCAAAEQAGAGESAEGGSSGAGEQAGAGGQAPNRLRLWVDRSFSISGAGTVVTGTLTAGQVRTGDRLQLHTAAGSRTVDVRSLQSQGGPVEQLTPVCRAALNLRGISQQDIGRGDVLTSDDWWLSGTVDVRWASGQALDEVNEHITAHIGTAALQARLRPFDADHARLLLGRALPLRIGDRIVLRDPGAGQVAAGVQVLDVDPPELTRRGAGRRRGEALAALPVTGSVRAEVARRRVVAIDTLRRFGLAVPEAQAPSETKAASEVRAGHERPAPEVVPTAEASAGIVRIDRWLVDRDALRGWAQSLRQVHAAHVRADPLSAGLPAKAAGDAIELPVPELLPAIVRAAGLTTAGGRIRSPEARADLGAAEAAIAEVERRLRTAPFAAPEAEDLARLRLGSRELAAAERVGRLIRLADGIVLLADGPARAMRILAALDQPFTTSQARRALHTTRRVAIPLLEHLDARGWTRRLDGTHREVVR